MASSFLPVGGDPKNGEKRMGFQVSKHHLQRVQVSEYKEFTQIGNPWDAWDWYIYLHLWLKFMVNVGKYISPMDPMGNIDVYRSEASLQLLDCLP